MKRIALIALFTALVASGAAAQSLELIGGVGFTPMFTYQFFITPIVNWETSVDRFEPELAFSLGAEYGFFRVALGYAMSFDTSVRTATDSGSSTTTDDSTSYDTGSWLSIAAYGMLPFKAAGMQMYAMLGGKYLVNLSYVDADGNDLKEGMSDDQLANLDRFFLQLGVGAEFKLSRDMAMHLELLGGWKIPSRLDNEYTDASSTNALRSLSLDVALLFSYAL